MMSYFYVESSFSRTMVQFPDELIVVIESSPLIHRNNNSLSEVIISPALKMMM